MEKPLFLQTLNCATFFLQNVSGNQQSSMTNYSMGMDISGDIYMDTYTILDIYCRIHFMAMHNICNAVKLWFVNCQN